MPKRKLTRLAMNEINIAFLYFILNKYLIKNISVKNTINSIITIFLQTLKIKLAKGFVKQFIKIE